MLKKIFLTIPALLLIMTITTYAAESFVKPRLLIAEIANYGVNELKAEVAINLYHSLWNHVNFSPTWAVSR